MYCVIQKIKNKKPDMFGGRKALEVTATTCSFGEEAPRTSYSFRYSDDRFERPILDAYKISVHKSYRNSGKVKKAQWVIGTMSYYDIAGGFSWAGDHLTKGQLDKKLAEMEISESEVWDMVYAKLDPLIATIKKEFEATEEYKVAQEQKVIINSYKDTKRAFEEKYGSNTYDYCYDVFGVLRNRAELERLETLRKAQQEYSRRSYYEYNHSNYNKYDFSGYFGESPSTCTDEQKEYLRSIYKAAAMKMHPDIAQDDGEAMKFLNKLKEEWGI